MPLVELNVEVESIEDIRNIKEVIMENRDSFNISQIARDLNVSRYKIYKELAPE